MKKIVYIFMISCLPLLAQTDSYYVKIEIIKKVFSQISKNEMLKIWTYDKKLNLALSKLKNILVVKKCKDSNILIIKDEKDYDKSCFKKDIFVLNYNLLSKIPNSFGSLFWKKGRPNIVFLKDRIEKSNIKISKKLERYIEKKIW